MGQCCFNAIKNQCDFEIFHIKMYDIKHYTGYVIFMCYLHVML